MKEVVRRIQELADQRGEPDPVERLRRTLAEVCETVNLKIQIIEAKRRARLSNGFKGE